MSVAITLILGFLVTTARAEVLQYKERKVHGMPVQGPIRPQRTPTPLPVYPVSGSLEEIARMADEVRRRKGILGYAFEPTMLPGEVPTLLPGVTPTATPTAIPIDNNAPEVIADNGELLDITVRRTAPERDAEAAKVDLSRGHELAWSAFSTAMKEDRVLPPPYSEMYEAAVKSLGQKKWDEAVPKFREIREKRPRFVTAWVLEIGTLAQQGKQNEAGEVATAFDRLFPEARTLPFVDHIRGK